MRRSAGGSASDRKSQNARNFFIACPQRSRLRGGRGFRLSGWRVVKFGSNANNSSNTGAFYVNANNTSSNDNTNGQVMVEIPKFAYKYIYVAATNVHSWSISSVLLPGYEWHPVLKTLRVFVSMDTTLLVRRNQMKIQSKTYPKITKSKKERIVRVPYNIQEIVVSGMDDTDERVYEYDETILSDTGRTMDEQMLLMRKIEWPEARLNIDYIIDENQSELQALENWISDGAMLRDDDGKYVGNAEKVKWEGTHLEPSRIIDGEKISEKTLAEFNKATSIAALKAVLVKVMKGSP